MEELIRLVRLVQNYNSKLSPLINFQDSGNLDTRLFNLVRDAEVKTDEEAAYKLYGAKNLSANYRMLKSRIKKKLINHVHFLELPESKFSPINLVKVQCASMLFEVESLKSVSEFKLADKILDQALTLAKENEVNEYIVPILEQKQWISNSLCDKKKYSQGIKKLEHYYVIERAEREANKIFLDRTMNAKAFDGVRSKLLDNLPKDITKLEQLWTTTKSSRIFHYYHFFSIQYQELQGNYTAVADIISKAEELVKQGVVHTNWFNYRFNSYAMVYAHLQTKQYEKGLQLAEQYLPHFHVGSINWFAFLENYLLLALHSKNYTLFYQKYRTAVDCNSILNLPVAHLERWEIFRRYCLVILKYRIKTDFVEKDYQAVSAFSVLPKDKEGYNIAILVLDTFEQLSNPDIEDHEANVERLRKYISKYLRGPKAERARLFLRFLILVFKEDFNCHKIKSKGNKMFEKLSNTPLPGDAFSEVEIVPYEHLWELVIEIVEERSKTLA